VHPPPHGIIHVRNLGLRVAGDHERELRRELELILAHEPRADLVTASQALDLGLVPLARGINLLRVDQPSAHQGRKLCLVALLVRRKEHVRTGHRGIIAKDRT